MIGQPGSRAALDTPALVIDIKAFEPNVARLCARLRRGAAPHAKTHKSVACARRQIEAIGGSSPRPRPVQVC
jgi:D-serine deaminase-like pyridoxal phosphate-dependent protein